MANQNAPLMYVDNIRQTGLDIYAPIEVGDPDLWIPARDLEKLLTHALVGKEFADMPNRTRSKAVKSAVCEAMGYPACSRFKRTRPRFPGQCLDVHSQKSSNLQIYNEDIDPIRRYAIIVLSPHFSVTRVRVLTGEELALLDKTGTLTRKYQARLVPGEAEAELITDTDTGNLIRLTSQYDGSARFTVSPTAHPAPGHLIPIRTVFDKLRHLVGITLTDLGCDQERNRGGQLHRIVCDSLGYPYHQDDGTFPDIRHQLVEVKLQTSPTIDLGLVSPDSTEPLDTPWLANIQVRHRDVRYVVFYGERDGAQVRLTNLYVSTGEAFFTRFQKFGGLIVNAKLQIPLPCLFFDD